MSSTDYYKTLGLERSATDEEIKKAYKKMAVKHHPDKGGNEEDFKLVAEAYDVLSDKEKRKLYDMGLYDKTHGRTHQFVDPHEMFRQFFDGDNSFFFPMSSMMSSVSTSTQVIGDVRITKETKMSNGMQQETITETNMQTGETRVQTRTTRAPVSHQGQTFQMFFG